MEKKLLTIGFKISHIQGFENIGYSNYSLSFSSEKRWKNKLSTIDKWIVNNELQCILIVIGRGFFCEIENLSNECLLDFLKICKRTNCVIAIQEYLLEDKPLYYDYYSNKKYSIEELQEIVDSFEKDSLSNNKNETNNRLQSVKSESNVFDEFSGISDDEFLHAELTPSSDVNGYRRKLDMLKDTEKIFPRVKEIIEVLKKEFDDTVTFKYLNQVLDIAKSEIIEQFSNEILNIYIPKHYGYKFEFDDFIQLFEKYLKSIEQLNISVEINETSSGINYKFISNNQRESITDLPKKFNRFTEFIDLCEREPETALHLLEVKNIASDYALELIQRLSKKYKRLALDIQQQQERLELSYKQEVQSELFEHGFSDTPFSLVKNSFSIKTFENVYCPNENELKLISIIQKHGDDLEISNIKSDLCIIKDSEIKVADRKKSGYKLKKLLNKLLKKGIESTEKIVVESIINYINNNLI